MLQRNGIPPHTVTLLLLPLLLLVAPIVSSAAGAAVTAVTLFPSNSLSIAEGAGFLAFLDTGTAPRAGQWVHCSVRIGNEQYSLDSDQVHRIGERTTVERYDGVRCGVRVRALEKTVEPKWTLYGTSAAGEDSTATLTLTVLPSKFIDQLNVTVSGSSAWATVTCPDKDASRYCRIVDAQANVYESCTKTIDVTQPYSHFWCHAMFWGAMTERITKINVIVEENDRDIVATVEETADHVVLTCRYRSSVSLCRALSETDNRQLLLLDGHLSGRYSAFDTKINKGTCSLEIKKPLIPGDVGVWRIYQQLNPTDFTGCVFDLTPVVAREAGRIQTRQRARLPELTAKSIEIFHDPRSAVTTKTELSCEVPYALQYCYLSGPTAGDYAPQRFDRLRSLGVCQFEVTNITSGMWACGINDANGAEDHLTYYNVSVYRQPGRAVVGQLTASAGDREQRLLCKTILDLPIDICRFVDPAGEVHGLSDQMKPSADAHYRYHGAGLREGECGLEIVALQERDFGRWKCLFKVQNREYELPLDVVEEAMSAGVIVAICLSVAVVLAIVGFIAYRKLNRRHNGPSYTVSSSMTNVSNGSHHS